jgi:hypothetical protein
LSGTARDASQLIAVLALRHEVHVQMATGVAISAVVYLVRMEGGVDGFVFEGERCLIRKGR